jgi:DNA invertase Pin-like site-specific DNA recombinase
MKKAYGYKRVSTNAQSKDDVFGLDAQRTAIEQYAAKNDYEIIKWYTDVDSGAKEQRPELNRLIYTADPPGAEGAEAIIVAKSDRISRDIKHYFYFQMLLGKKNVELISANANEDFAVFGAFASVIQALVMSFAQFELERINERMTGGRIAKVSSGKTNCGGRPPLGYRVKADPGNPKNGQLEIYGPEAQIVRLIYKMRAEKKTLREISLEVYLRFHKDFAVSKIHYILNNKVYHGIYNYSGADVYAPELRIVKTERTAEIMAALELEKEQLESFVNSCKGVVD